MRTFIAGLLLLIGIALVPFAVVGVWTGRVLLPTDSFADLSTDIVQEPAVQDAFAARFVDELVARVPTLGLARFVLEPAVKEALRTSQFESLFRATVTTTHDQLERGDPELSLDLDALLPIVRDLVAQVNGSVASRIPDAVGLPDITVVRKDQVPQLWFGVQVTRRVWWVFPVLMLLALATGVAVAKRHAMTLLVAGLGVAFVSLLLVLALRVGQDMLSNVVGPQVDVQAFDAGYHVVTDSLVTQTIMFGVGGVLSAVIGVVFLVRTRATVRPTGWA